MLISFASVFLGSGAPLLPRRIVTPPLQLLEATAYGADFATLRYAVPKTEALCGQPLRNAEPQQPEAVGHDE